MASNVGGGLSPAVRGTERGRATGEFICSNEQVLFSRPVSVLGALPGLCSRNLRSGAWRTAPLITGVRVAPVYARHPYISQCR